MSGTSITLMTSHYGVAMKNLQHRKLLLSSNLRQLYILRYFVVNSLSCLPRHSYYL